MDLFRDINDETKSGMDILTENAGILSAAIGLLALNMFGVGGIKWCKFCYERYDGHCRFTENCIYFYRW